MPSDDIRNADQQDVDGKKPLRRHANGDLDDFRSGDHVRLAKARGCVFVKNTGKHAIATACDFLCRDPAQAAPLR
jgi:hypothetical protein